jgi:hypothetical protein
MWQKLKPKKPNITTTMILKPNITTTMILKPNIAIVIEPHSKIHITAREVDN